MKKINYQSIEIIPAEMRQQLAQAKTADIAEAIYRKWENRCFIEPRSRAFIWLNAGIGMKF